MEYDFWRAELDAIPGDPEFSPTNASRLMIVPVGPQSLNRPGGGIGPFTVAGYAKLAVTNSYYSGVYAYLGQYFDKAYKVNTNGVTTTNTTGILSSYGDFFPTEPGPAALVTMPDVDTGQRGTNIVYAISLNVDANHDGVMDLSFSGADATSGNRPFTFWVNNDFDRAHTVDLTDFEQDDLGTVDIAKLPTYQRVPDCSYVNVSGQPVIPSSRDLEDYFRLWTPGLAAVMAAAPTNYAAKLTLSGDGQIRIFRAYEASGGTNYLFDAATATNQITNSALFYVGLLTSSSSLVLNNRTNEHFIFCGAHTGSATVHLQILDGGQNIVADVPTYLQINDIKQMYERWTVGDRPNYAPANAAYLAADGLPVSAAKFLYAPPQDTNTPYILFVHGWNMNTFDKDSFAETAFKRLYWQGYQGRFGSFRWPTYYAFPAGKFRIKQLIFKISIRVNLMRGNQACLCEISL